MLSTQLYVAIRLWLSTVPRYTVARYLSPRDNHSSLTRHSARRHSIPSLHSQLLGTRRLVVIDMVKPFLAAFAGALILEKKEPVTPLMWAGMVRMTSP